MRLGKNKTMDTPCLFIGSEEISLVEDVELLGGTIDRHLRFSKHITDIARKVRMQIQVFQRHKKLFDTNAKNKII